MSSDEETCGARFPAEAPEDPQGPCILAIGHAQPHKEGAGSMWWDSVPTP